jgi:plastocyanin
MNAFKKALSAVRRRSHFMFLGLLLLLILFTPLPGSSALPSDKTFHIEASSFQFSPAEIKINPGDRVTIELTSMDVVHGLAIDGYDVDLTADPGQTAQITFVADRSGIFYVRCSVACGNLHPFMLGRLRVGSNTLFIRSIGVALLILLGGYWSLSR